MKRRQLLKSTAALSAVSALGAPAIAQAPKKITYLTWNLVHLEAPLKGWFEGFKKARPGVEIEWVDKKGPELPAYYQTQLAANTPPDVIDIQGALGLEYAAIAVVANYAAGRGDSAHAIPLDKIGAILEEAMGRVRRIIGALCEE